MAPDNTLGMAGWRCHDSGAEATRSRHSRTPIGALRRRLDNGPQPVIVRPANHDDVEGMARVHVESAAAVYGELAPVTAQALERRRVQWQTMIATPGRASFVAETAREIVGVLNVGPSDGPPGEGRLSILYVLPAWWGRSAGQLLLDRAHEELARQFSCAVLTVLADNGRARRFYERNGWEFVEVEAELHFGGRPTLIARYRRSFA